MNPFLGSIFRHALSGIGGALVVVGVDAADAQSFIAAAGPVLTGILSWGIGQLWSFADKRGR
jgi:hypothetical protein